MAKKSKEQAGGVVTGKRMYEGLPVVDAPEGDVLAFTVTKDIAKKARANDPGQCAAAVAASQEYHTDVRVHISRTYVKAPAGNHWVRYMTPEAISREIVSFDRSHQFAPGDYKVIAPTSQNRLGADRGVSTRTGNGQKKRGPVHVTANVRHTARESMSSKGPRLSKAAKRG